MHYILSLRLGGAIKAVKTDNFPRQKGFCHEIPMKTQYYHTHKIAIAFYFLLPTSYFLLPTSYFLFPTSYFLLLTSYFRHVEVLEKRQKIVHVFLDNFPTNFLNGCVWVDFSPHCLINQYHIKCVSRAAPGFAWPAKYPLNYKIVLGQLGIHWVCPAYNF